MINVGRTKEVKDQQFCIVAVFYGVPVLEELGIKENMIHRKVRDDVKKKVFSFPYYSQELFSGEEAASNFLPQFVRNLIEKGLLPKDVVEENGELDETRCKAAIVPLTLTQVELKSTPM